MPPREPSNDQDPEYGVDGAPERTPALGEDILAADVRRLIATRNAEGHSPLLRQAGPSTTVLGPSSLAHGVLSIVGGLFDAAGAVEPDERLVPPDGPAAQQRVRAARDVVQLVEGLREKGAKAADDYVDVYLQPAVVGLPTFALLALVRGGILEMPRGLLIRATHARLEARNPRRRGPGIAVGEDGGVLQTHCEIVAFGKDGAYGVPLASVPFGPGTREDGGPERPSESEDAMVGRAVAELLDAVELGCAMRDTFGRGRSERWSTAELGAADALSLADALRRVPVYLDVLGYGPPVGPRSDPQPRYAVAAGSSTAAHVACQRRWRPVVGRLAKDLGASRDPLPDEPRPEIDRILVDGLGDGRTLIDNVLEIVFAPDHATESQAAERRRMEAVEGRAVEAARGRAIGKSWISAGASLRGEEADDERAIGLRVVLRSHRLDIGLWIVSDDLTADDGPGQAVAAIQALESGLGEVDRCLGRRDVAIGAHAGLHHRAAPGKVASLYALFLVANLLRAAAQLHPGESMPAMRK